MKNTKIQNTDLRFHQDMHKIVDADIYLDQVFWRSRKFNRKRNCKSLCT